MAISRMKASSMALSRRNSCLIATGCTPPRMPLSTLPKLPLPSSQSLPSLRFMIL
jgi:hypothetical protein